MILLSKGWKSMDYKKWDYHRYNKQMFIMKSWISWNLLLNLQGLIIKSLEMDYFHKKNLKEYYLLNNSVSIKWSKPYFITNMNSYGKATVVELLIIKRTKK